MRSSGGWRWRHHTRARRPSALAHQNLSQMRMKSTGNVGLPCPTYARPAEPRAKKTKRLFQFVIHQLYNERSIVLWDRPIRPLPRLQLSLAYPLWKADMSAVSTASVISIDVNNPGELSDPSPTKEAYLPLTPT
ncbi:hypothetical protein C8Q72DRAFT_955197, partial [Fomitopsis betulina]